MAELKKELQTSGESIPAMHSDYESDISTEVKATVFPLLQYKVEYDSEGNVKHRKVMQTVRNMEIVLENDERFSEKIRYDEFSRQIFLVGDMPWETDQNYRAWGSNDDAAAFSIIQSDYGLTGRNDLYDALKNVSMRHKFHPVKDILNSLHWDGQARIKDLLPDYLGAERNDYNAECMKLFMLGAVNRVFQPGCKFDYCPILYGQQGLGKSTFLQLLALNDAWFTDSIDSLDGDKAAQMLQGVWIAEFGELKALAKTTSGTDGVKRFISATQDRYRLPYERRADTFLRQTVFCGTTNKSEFLQDETGNRRFLVIHTGVNKPTKSLFETESIQEFRQAWAEAVHIYQTENPKLVLPEACLKEAFELQQAAMADDGKKGIISEYLKNKKRTCAIEIWTEALKENGRPAKWQSSEINDIISQFPEWERMKYPTEFSGYGSQRGFKRIYSIKEECSPETDESSDKFVLLDENDQIELPFS